MYRYVIITLSQITSRAILQLVHLIFSDFINTCSNEITNDDYTYFRHFGISKKIFWKFNIV
jgi:hypothetical protein